MLHVFYTGDGKWRECAAADCHASNQDWGVDSMTYTLWLRWKTSGNAKREYEVTHDPVALQKARAAFDFVEHAQVFARGACPAIDYQLADGGGNHLKTLEVVMSLYATSR